MLFFDLIFNNMYNVYLTIIEFTKISFVNYTTALEK